MDADFTDAIRDEPIFALSTTDLPLIVVPHVKLEYLPGYFPLLSIPSWVFGPNPKISPGPVCGGRVTFLPSLAKERFCSGFENSVKI